MDTRTFLELVVPDGTMCIADHVTFGDGKKVFVHYPFTDKDKAAWFAQKMDERDHTIYFALATFKETFTNKNGKLRLKRTQKNVERLKAIWLDIDFKDCPAKELVPKLGEFIKTTGLPKPSMVVNSGGGLHVYWCCNEPMEVDEWVPLAEGLKQLCKEHDLPADHVCTSDAARVLRPVGTHNRKRGVDEVRLVAGVGKEYTYGELLEPMPEVDNSALPAHLRGKGVDTSEYSDNGFAPREVNTKEVIKNCNVLRYILKTGGEEQSEPEWNATLLLLRFLPDGAKFVHPMSKKHIDYTPTATQEKWQEKLEADVSGPPLCKTLEQYGHTERCQSCPIYQSKRSKTPLALGYTNGAEKPTQKPQKNSHGNFVSTPTHSYPRNWRDIPGNLGVEHKLFNKADGVWEWEKVLNRTWRLDSVQRSANTGEYTLTVTAKQVTGPVIKCEMPGSLAYGCPRTWELLGAAGAILTANEKTHWTNLMATWLSKLQEENAVEDTTDQLGWIERVDEHENKNIVGFASGGAAFFADGTETRSVVNANHKHQGIAKYYTPVGSPDKWGHCFDFYKKQGLDHVLTMLASAFAGPLIKFTGQSGAVMSVVSTSTSAGKSLSLESAAAVWGNPKLGTITLDDTPTTVKNKVAYLQNITAYWDEVRGNEQKLNDFLQTAFQLTQGKDRERADRSARTISAQTWHTLLVATSNESLFDLAVDYGKASDAGSYRFFELDIGADEHPARDVAIAGMVSELQNNYGRVGEAYAKYLATNQKKVRKIVQAMMEKVGDHVDSQPAERFWLATVASILAGATIANKAGLTDFDIPKMWDYLIGKYQHCRNRVNDSRNSTEPKELLAAYMRQHQDECLIVDKLKVGRGGTYTPQVVGNPSGLRKLTYQVGQDQNIVRIPKHDFTRWLMKSRGIRLSGELHVRFLRDCGMREIKAILGAGTRWAVGQRTLCLDFDLDDTV